MIWLKIISKFIKAFRSGETPRQIALGFCLGFLLALMPFWTIQAILIFVLLILLNINLAAGTVAFLLATIFFLPHLLDPVFHSLGYFILSGIPALQNFWEWFYNTPAGSLSRFNNTVVLGSFIGGFTLTIPVYFGITKLVVAYRSGLEERIKKLKIVQVITGSKVYKMYMKIRDIGGE
ncbi:TIGR03546 family protein [candidate division KSB1 bacterium]|nr:TIGR03546 family protein [candidate division KSB1 bacterium]MBL7093355.1 TIGR03546 family protein [candidate division KSB1 bacterium]